MPKWPYEQWIAGRTFYRIYDVKYGSSAFNPNTNSDPKNIDRGGRFHPFDNAQAKTIQSKTIQSKKIQSNKIGTLYFGDHPLGAFAETIMRDDNKARKLSIKDIEDNRLALLSADTTINLVNLSHSSLKGIYDGLLIQGKNTYAITRHLAASIYTYEPKAHGIHWIGKQLAAQKGVFMSCAVLFKDRCQDIKFQALHDHPLNEGAGYEWLLNAAQTLSFTLPDKYI